MATTSAVSSLIGTEGPPQPKQIALEGYLGRNELARLLGVSARTIDRWHSLRNGPPRIAIGRTILYNLDSVRTWLQCREDDVAPLHRGRGAARSQRRTG